MQWIEPTDGRWVFAEDENSIPVAEVLMIESGLFQATLVGRHSAGSLLGDRYGSIEEAKKAVHEWYPVSS